MSRHFSKLFKISVVKPIFDTNDMAQTRSKFSVIRGGFTIAIVPWHGLRPRGPAANPHPPPEKNASQLGCSKLRLQSPFLFHKPVIKIGYIGIA